MKYFLIISYIYVMFLTACLFDNEQINKCKNRSLFTAPILVGLIWPMTLPFLISDLNGVSCP